MERAQHRPEVVLVAVAATMSVLVGAALAEVGLTLGALPMVAVPVVAAVIVASRRWPLVAPLAVLVILPLHERDLPGDLPLRLGDLAVVGAVALVVVNELARGRPALPVRRPMGWAAALVLIAGLSTTVAVDHGAAVNQVLVLVAGLLFGLAVATVVRTRQAVSTAAAVIVGMGTVVCALAVPGAGQLQASFGAAVVTNRATSTFADPNELGAFAGAILLLALAGSVASTSRPGRLAYGAAGVVALVALSLSLSRGAWIGTSLGLVAFVAMVPSGRRRLLIGAVALLVVVGAVAALQPGGTAVRVVTQRLATITTPEANPYDNRLVLWRKAIDLVESRPLLGVGPGGFPEASERDLPGGFALQPEHPHNLMLTVAVETGLVGATAFVGFGIGLVRLTAATVGRWRRSASVPETVRTAGLASALLLFVGQGLVDYTFRNASILLLAWTLVGLLVAMNRLAADPEPGGRLMSGHRHRTIPEPSLQ